MRIYLPPDANTLLSVADHCLRSRNYVNVIVAGKQPAPQWLDWTRRCGTARPALGIWDWASNDARRDAGRGDGLRRRRADDGDAGRGRPPAQAAAGPRGPRGQRRRPDGAAAAVRASARARRQRFDSLFTARQAGDLRVPRLPMAGPPAAARPDATPSGFHVHGFKEEGTTTTPFDMTVLNGLDRFHLALAAIERVPRRGGRQRASRAALAQQAGRPHRLRPRAWRGHAGGPGLAVAADAC